MDSIGGRLSGRREEKQCSVEQAARETHIAKKFLEALEQENFDEFPGESYIIGFLRKYSEYLELDAEESISLYRNTLMQEQPSPMDELLETKTKVPWGILGIIAGAAILIALGVIFIPRINFSRATTNAGASDDQAGEDGFETVVFSNEIIEQEFSAQTAIRVPLEDESYEIQIRTVSDPLTLFVGDQQFSLENGASGFVDLNQDSSPDLRIILKSFMDNGNPILRLDRVVAGAFAQSSANQNVADELVLPGNTTESSRERVVQNLLNAATAEPFFIEAIFRGPVLLRYLLSTGERSEQLYRSGDRVQIEVEDFVYLWLSNAGKVQLTIAGQPVRLGADGEIAVNKIAWNENNLELIPLY